MKKKGRKLRKEAKRRLITKGNFARSYNGHPLVEEKCACWLCKKTETQRYQGDSTIITTSYSTLHSIN